MILLLALACAADPGAARAPGVDDPVLDTASPDDLGAPLSYARDIVPLWSPTCTDGCHPGEESMADLRPDAGLRDLLDIPSTELPLMDRVEAGNPDRSYLVHKLDGTHIPIGGMGRDMPPTGALLGAAERDLVRRWIQQGAAP